MYRSRVEVRARLRVGSRPAILALVVSLAASPSALGSQESPIRQRSLADDLQLFSQVLNHIRLNHADSLDLHQLVLAAIQGMLEAADPHSWVIPALRLDPGREEALREGRHLLLPVTFEFVGRFPQLVAVAPGTGASRQDLYPGDALLAINGRPVVAESSEELALELSGPKGEEVELTLERWNLDGSKRDLRILVKREVAGEGTAVSQGFFLEPGIGYVRIMSFDHPEVAGDLRDQLDRLKKDGLRGLVLDLRGNSGGRLDQAAEVAGVFLPRGAVVFTTEGRRREVTDTVRVERSFLGTEDRYSIAVLVDEGTASAGELVAAAVQDHDRGKVVGRPTFGKALLTAQFLMSDGSQLNLVVGRVRTPCGRMIQRPYRGIPVPRYWALAGLDPDTTQLPRCRSSGGRTLYGGGGVYPDRLIPPAPPPAPWKVRAAEGNVATRWAAAFVSEWRERMGSVEAMLESAEIQDAALASFRARASEQQVPLEVVADDDLLSYLLPEVVRLRWGLSEAIRVSAGFDPSVLEAALMVRDAPR